MFIINEHANINEHIFIYGVVLCIFSSYSLTNPVQNLLFDMNPASGACML